MSEAADNCNLKIITKKEAAKHTTKTDLWVILHNKVYYSTQGEIFASD
jgi:cytochrome b involved in lipid metabolism